MTSILRPELVQAIANLGEYIRERVNRQLGEHGVVATGSMLCGEVGHQWRIAVLTFAGKVRNSRPLRGPLLNGQFRPIEQIAADPSLDSESARYLCLAMLDFKNRWEV